MRFMAKYCWQNIDCALSVRRYSKGVWDKFFLNWRWSRRISFYGDIMMGNKENWMRWSLKLSNFVELLDNVLGLVLAPEWWKLSSIFKEKGGLIIWWNLSKHVGSWISEGLVGLRRNNCGSRTHKRHLSYIWKENLLGIEIKIMCAEFITNSIRKQQDMGWESSKILNHRLRGNVEFLVTTVFCHYLIKTWSELIQHLVFGKT